MTLSYKVIKGLTMMTVEPTATVPKVIAECKRRMISHRAKGKDSLYLYIVDPKSISKNTPVIVARYVAPAPLSDELVEALGFKFLSSVELSPAPSKKPWMPY